MADRREPLLPESKDGRRGCAGAMNSRSPIRSKVYPSLWPGLVGPGRVPHLTVKLLTDRILASKLETPSRGHV
jgi:hypothetical protein